MSTESFLHGIEVIEIDTGIRPIRTQRFSIIGLVGTAPDADAAAFPINQPVAIIGREPELIAKLGNRGTLPWAVDGIMDQIAAVIVVIRVARAPQPRVSTLLSLQKPKLDVIETVTRNASGDIDMLDQPDVIAISAVTMGDIGYEKNVDWAQYPGGGVRWITNEVVESVDRRVGTTDPLAHSEYLLAVSKVYMGEIVYTEGTHYTVVNGMIEWQGADHTEPREHDQYFVSHTWGRRPDNANDYSVAYSYYENGLAEAENIIRTDSATSDYDTPAFANIFRIRSITQGATTYVQGVDYELLNGIHWIRNSIVETVTRVAGSDDALANAGVLVISDVRQGASVYTAGVDWQQNGNAVQWLGGAEPADGSAYQAVYDYGNRPADGSTYEATYDFRTGEAVAMSKVVGGVNVDTGAYEGVHALLSAQSEVKLTPRILIAPGFTQYQAVTQEMVGIAEELRAVIIADGPSTNDYDAIGMREAYGSKRVFIVDPWVKYYNTVIEAEDIQTPSGRVAGMICNTDDTIGFWASPSNKLMNGILGLHRPISFNIHSRSTRANFLNENEVTTIIQKDGFRLWGNRTASWDQRYAFLSSVRTDDVIAESLEDALLWAVDRPITRSFFEDVCGSVNLYMRSLAARGAIVLGQQNPCWVDPALNTPDQIIQGKVTFNFDYDRVYPAEHVTFRRYINHDYLKTLFEDANFLRNVSA